MAASTLHRPGTEYGPCPMPCEHVDCATTRQMANDVCHWCSEPIGFDTLFYETEQGLAHALCEEQAAEAHRSVPLLQRSVPLLQRVKVKASRPSMRGGWQCLLVCGCDVHEPTAKRRPKAVDHVCPPNVEESA